MNNIYNRNLTVTVSVHFLHKQHPITVDYADLGLLGTLSSGYLVLTISVQIHTNYLPKLFHTDMCGSFEHDCADICVHLHWKADEFFRKM